jgi:hypothetical protein
MQEWKRFHLYDNGKSLLYRCQEIGNVGKKSCCLRLAEAVAKLDQLATVPHEPLKLPNVVLQ